MKKIINLGLIFILLVSFTGCADRKTINNVTYDTYGLFNANSKENPNIEYELSVGNVIWGVLLFETLIAPIYFFGFSLWEPVGPKITNPNLKGVIRGNPEMVNDTPNVIIYKN